MRKYLLPENGKQYKAGMHTHSNISDGLYTPQELKTRYQKYGYSIVAFSDHNKLVAHNDLTDDKFVAITSYEFDFYLKPDEYKCTHISYFALDPNNDVDPIAGLDRFRKLNQINDYVRIGHEKGFLVSLNHPGWSCETAEDYLKYDGFDFVEVHNTCSTTCGMPEYDRVYDEMLRAGKHLGPFAVDDAHGPEHIAGGWVTICADKLDYASVMNALQKGEFYSTTGPEIKALYVEDGNLCVETSEAAEIRIFSQGRAPAAAMAEPHKVLFGAKFSLEKRGYFGAVSDFVRIVVVDHAGHRAWSNAYWLDEIAKK